MAERRLAWLGAGFAVSLDFGEGPGYLSPPARCLAGGQNSSEKETLLLAPGNTHPVGIFSKAVVSGHDKTLNRSTVEGGGVG